VAKVGHAVFIMVKVGLAIFCSGQGCSKLLIKWFSVVRHFIYLDQVGLRFKLIGHAFFSFSQLWFMLAKLKMLMVHDDQHSKVNGSSWPTQKNTWFKLIRVGLSFFMLVQPSNPRDQPKSTRTSIRFTLSPSPQSAGK
jgi:hypothetical protein